MKPEQLAEYAGKRVLVLGGSGFIGQHLTGALAEQGADVFAAGRRKKTEQANSKAPGSIVELHCDVTVPSQLSEAFNAAQPEIIFNLAVAPRGSGDINDYRKQFAVTFGGTTNIAELIIDRQPQALLVQLGSSEEYGRSPTPFHEDQNDAPVSAYSLAKCAATRFLIATHDNCGLPAIIVRPTVVYGPGQTGDMLIPSLMSAYIDHRIPDLTPGAQTRDFIFIDDLIAGLLILGLMRQSAGEIFNLSSGIASPLKTVTQMVADLCQWDGDPGLGRRPYRLHEVMEHCASFAKVQAAAGWSPKTNIQDGLRQTVDWWRQLRKAKAQSTTG